MNDRARSHVDLFLDVAADLLDRGYHVRFRARGASMHPAISEGDAITIEPVRSDELAAGDVVLYRSRNRVIAHRVVAILSGLEPTLILRGDALPCCDGPVRPHLVLGRVARIDPAHGRLNRAGAPLLWRFARACGSRLKRILSADEPSVWAR